MEGSRVPSRLRFGPLSRRMCFAGMVVVVVVGCEVLNILACCESLL